MSAEKKGGVGGGGMRRTILSAGAFVSVFVIGVLCSASTSSDNIAKSSPYTLSDRRNIHLGGLSIDTRTEHGVGVQSKGDIGTLRRLISDKDNFVMQTPSYKGNWTWLVHVVEPLRKVDANKIQSVLGAKLAVYIPHNTYVVVGSVDLAKQLDALDCVHWVGLFPGAGKFAQSLILEEKFMPKAKDPFMESPALIVDLSPRAWTDKEKTALVEEWRKDYSLLDLQLEKLSPEWVTLGVRPTTGGSKVDRADVLALARWLSEHAAVHAIDLVMADEVKNKFAAGLTQSFSEDPSKPGAKPIWDKGLQGQGIIAQVVDTGLDFDHCYFADSENPDPPTATVQLENRKVVFYDEIHNNRIESLGDKSGHGTHVAGSLAGGGTGAVYEDGNMEEFEGMAPEAKIAFWSIQNKDGTGIRSPATLTDLYQPAYDQGIRLSSNSWGCVSSTPGACNVYNHQAMEADKFINEHPSFLMLFAAGNSGQKSFDGSVEAPATAKNLISVGATQSSEASFDSSVDMIDFTAREQYIRQREGYSDSWKCCPSLSSPFNQQWADYCCRDRYETFLSVKEFANQIGEDNPAMFTARGPAADGRFKPQLMAPGEPIVSAKSDQNLSTGNCGLKADVGTSMATPILAGSAALAMQYLHTGYYPSGVATEGDEIEEPSAAMMIAWLTAGSQRMHGYIDPEHSGLVWVTLDKEFYPGIYQGFGRIQLDKTLKFDDSDFNLYLNDSYTMQEPGEMMAFCVHPSDKLPKSGKFKVVIAWTDVEGSVAASPAIKLVNDLDLQVGTSTENVKPGNFGEQGEQGRRDPFNNVEMVEWDYEQTNTADEIVTIVVRASHIFAGKEQTFAVAVVGDFGKVDAGGCLPEEVYREFEAMGAEEVNPEKKRFWNPWYTVAIAVAVLFCCCIGAWVTVFALLDDLIDERIYCCCKKTARNRKERALARKQRKKDEKERGKRQALPQQGQM